LRFRLSTSVLKAPPKYPEKKQIRARRECRSSAKRPTKEKALNEAS